MLRFLHHHPHQSLEGLRVCEHDRAQRALQRGEENVVNAKSCHFINVCSGNKKSDFVFFSFLSSTSLLDLDAMPAHKDLYV